MSGTRANASARTRRAGGADINASGPAMGGRGMGPGPSPRQGQQQGQQRQGQGQQQQQQQPQVQPKLSISDAIGLITLRLGRVENIVHTIQTSPNDPTSIHEGENATLVDGQVFDNIVKRLEAIEQKQKSQAQGPTQSIPANILQNLVTVDRFTKEVKELRDMISASTSSSSASASTLDISSIKTEIADLKGMLIKLQMFAMETNNKLVGVIFNESPHFEMNQLSGDTAAEDAGLDMNAVAGSFFGSGTNLKEMIQQELAKEQQSSENSNNVVELVIEEEA